ncbi:CocE/NonD family hydrolase [Mycolicibacterium crocinum]|uniref:CocE/NonD family hydrolase n=1 Tax=Mycolicibacterium crocinum TaxID=388459 RepID=A0ABY3TIU5_9MYCO|nr:CocE/NonD family hydrolase [Mycolicibacterium crocinum]ULN41281.1 CocE/NonD family hydrolase [Mycolicibacterium crocinum]
MGASRFVGRVGGLAVALGVGAALFSSGFGVAWADGSTGSSAAGSNSGSASGDSGSSTARSTGASKTTGPSKRTAAGSGQAVGTGGARRGLKHSKAGAALSLADSAVSAHTTSSTDPTANTSGSSSVTPVASLAPRLPVLSTALHSALDPFTGGLPTLPVDSPLTLAYAALVRRESVIEATTSAASASNATSSLLSANPIQVAPTIEFIDGILNGNANAVAPTGIPLKYTLISAPNYGGKVTFSPTSTTGAFTYLPDVSVLNGGATEQFKILVAQNTQFDQFLTGLPIVGGFVPQVLVILQQAPVVSDILAPLIGSAQVASFDSTLADIPVGAPVAFTAMVTSFDGTLISTNFFPASTTAVPQGTAAPTVLNGPGIASPGATNPYTEWGSAGSGNLVPGIQTLRGDGYNVITWDPRGEFASGGILQLDSPFFEARDVTAIINWAVGTNPTGTDNPFVTKVATDSGDPLLGMVGGSYGGAIQWVSAATDSRIDAIVPGISWNSLNSSLYPDSAFKTAYASLLLLGLVTTGARINNQIYVGIVTGDLLGILTQVAQSVIASSGPTVLVGNVDIPTLMIQGTVDVLFTLDQAMANGQILSTDGTTVKTIWYCGGHGNCLNPASPEQDAIIMNSTMAWLDVTLRQVVNGVVSGYR